MQITLGQQYNVGEKPTVTLYIYINRHAGTPEKHEKQTRDNVVHHHTYGSSNIHYKGYNIDSHNPRIVLPTKETTVSQQVSHR